MNARAGDRALAGLLLIAAAITVAYWTLWFLIPGGRVLLASQPGDAAYIAFENAFPLADGWLTLCLCFAAAQLWRGSSQAGRWLWMSGSAALYLAGMDILYDLENGIYAGASKSGEAGAVFAEIFINTGTVMIAALCLKRAAAA